MHAATGEPPVAAFRNGAIGVAKRLSLHRMQACLRLTTYQTSPMSKVAAKRKGLNMSSSFQMLSSRVAIFVVLLAGLSGTELIAQIPKAGSSSPTEVPLNRDVRPDNILINDVESPPAGKHEVHRIKFHGDTKFASGASRAVGLYQPKIESRSAEAMAAAAKKFLGSLSEDLASRAVNKLESKERSQWTNLPARPGAGGVRLSDLNEEQIENTLDLLATMLSDSGYEKLRLIMLGDDGLIQGHRRSNGIGTEAFSIVIFGEPDAKKLWAIQFDGHHIGLNIAIKGQQMTLGPSFIGAQPFEFKLGEQTFRPMQGERDRAFKIAQSLNDEQFREALALKQRGQLRAGPGQDGNVPKPIGISCGDLTDGQKKELSDLLFEWVGWLPSDRAAGRMEQLKEEFDEMKFSWNGSREDGSDVSYTIQSPSLLIEFAYQDLGGTPQQHLHTQYRNLKNEYGKNFR